MKNSVTTNRDPHWLSRLIKALRQTVRRQYPYGLISVDFLLPATHPHIKVHRDLRLSTSPAWRLFFTAANLWLVLRWLTWSAWRARDNAVRLLGPMAQAAGAPPLVAQRREILRLALRHSVPPVAWYQYQLWKHPQQLWAYVYDSELPQFHQFYNGNTKGAGARMLADKWLFAQRCAAAGVTVTPTLAELRQGQSAALLALLQQHPTVFCKPRFGNASMGAFAVARNGKSLQMKELMNEAILYDKAASDTIATLLTKADYVVQPLLVNHAILQNLCEVQPTAFAEAISVRVLSRRRHDTLSLFCAYMEIPRHGSGGKHYAFVAIDDGGDMLHIDNNNWHYQLLQQRQPQVLLTASGIDIPFWPNIREQALKAHGLVDDVNIVAWDFIVTDAGAVLLEGNINWRVSPVQMLFGPLLPHLLPS